jgi:hypothetical protein
MPALSRRLRGLLGALWPPSRGSGFACHCGVGPEACRERKLWKECGILPPGVSGLPRGKTGIEVRYHD